MFFESERINKVLSELKGLIKSNGRLLDEVYIGEGKERPTHWRLFNEDELWGGYDKWCWFKTTATIPAEFKGKCVSLSIVTGKDGKWGDGNPQFLLHVNGKMAQGMDKNHSEFILTHEVGTDEVFEIELAAYSGIYHKANRLEFEAWIYEHNKEVERLYYNLKAPYDVALLYDKNDKIRIDIVDFLTKAINLLDLRVASSYEFYTSVSMANEFMELAFYKRYCGHSDVIANCIGHTHIDVAWLWTLEQTVQKAIRSFSSVLSLMEEYPEYVFMSSQPQLYKFVKENAPDVYRSIKTRVKEGRWEPEGAMWLEADCNLTSGESLIRQIIHGKKFFKEEFNKECKVLWLPDVFGYSAALPQILKKSGIDYFVTSKISWNEYNHFPYDTFDWQGIDGTHVFTQFINVASVTGSGQTGFFSTYNGQLLPAAVSGGWKMYQQKATNNETLVTFGYGDGGGGPNREMLEMYKRLEKGIPGCPRLKMSKALDAIKSIENNSRKSGRLPRWVGELYLEYHRGTYTSMAKNKKYNRKCEFLLQNAEVLSVINSKLLHKDYPSGTLFENWETVLLNQFHDIIPGSSIKEVYDDSHKQYEQVLNSAGKIVDDALQCIADNVSKTGVLVYNPTSFVRSDVLDYCGQKYFVRNIPAHGWKVVELVGKENKIKITGNEMSNEFFDIKIDENGNLESIFDKKNNREVLSGKGNILQAFEDKPFKYDAWDINIYYQEKMWEINDVVSTKVVEGNGVYGGLEITKRFLNSVITQTIIVYNDIPRIDFNTEVDWHEEHILLKAAFPVDVHANKATYEIQYGNLERPTHWNTSWDMAKFEVCGHKWADLSENGYGVSLLNDCKYGYDIKDGVMRLTLIKSATSPNPEADKGKHCFTYSLMPHSGDFREGGTIKHAYFINNPLMAAKANGKGDLPGEFSLARVDKDNVIIEVIKQSIDGEGYIIRVYEAFGKRTKATVSFGLVVSDVFETDLLENELRKKEINGNNLEIEIKPYEIKTFKFKV